MAFHSTLRQLQSDLIYQLVQLTIIFSALALYFTLSQNPYPYDIAMLLLALIAFSLWIQQLSRAHMKLARRLFVLGLNVSLIIAMFLIATPALVFVGLLLPFIGSLLISRSGLITIVVVYLVALLLNLTAQRTYPLEELVAMYALSTTLAWRTNNMLYITLLWYSDAQQHASTLLMEARDSQAELKQTLKSLETAYDIRTRMQHELVWLRKHAEEAQRMKERFAANISHELRTPLNLILGFSEVMYLSPEVYGEVHWSPKLRRDIFQIYRSSRHLLEMIDDILDLSHFEMSQFTVNMQLTNLPAFLNETVEIAANIFENSAIQFEVDIEPDLPAIEMDRTRIRQALLNLLNNARRFAEDGTVQLAVHKEKQQIIFRVSDTGPGIPHDQLASIFQDFHQVDASLSRKHGGVGLGLAITRRFVEAHKGHIRAESEPGKGAAFIFSLPLSQFTLPQTRIDTREITPCVVVVDRDPQVAGAIERYLDDFQIIQVPSIREINLDQHNPWAVIHNVRPDSIEPIPDLPVPYYRCSLPSQRWIAEDLTVMAYLEKPISTEQLIHHLKQIADLQAVLVIEDDRGFIQLVERIMNTYDPAIMVWRAYNGADAVELMREWRPDLILLDLTMPEMNGQSFLKLIDRSIPVITLTGTSAEELSERRGAFLIQHPGGLYPSEVLNCLRATMGVVKPRLAAQ